tara:strand:- start:687 stop:1334 length:648 start_codon:yes stop_codon:yes gene_type:complete
MSDILASIGVGLNQVFFGHPLDTCLTLIQNKKKWRNLPLKSYYRGYKYPLFSSMIFNSTVFPIYNRTIDYTQSGALSGLTAGVCVAPFVFLSEVGKVKRQTQQKLKYKDFIYSKGKVAVLSRECIAMSAYFGSYDYCKSLNLHPLISGAIAGVTNWSLTYPIDVIKSRQIAQNLSIREAIRYGNVWKGIHICLCRATIVNATNFYVYESLMKYLN